MKMNFLQKLLSLFKYLLPRNGLYYLSGSENLPPPLSAEEEQKVFENIKNNVEGAREPLITHNLRLVVYIAKKFESVKHSREDLISIGTIGLIKAVNTFSPERGIKLATYASRCIENEILMHLRKCKEQRNEVSIDDPLNRDSEGNELLLSDLLGSSPDETGRNIELEDERRILLKAVQRLHKREKLITELRFGLSGKKEHTQKEVADLLGISQSYISRLEKRIILNLRKELKKVM